MSNEGTCTVLMHSFSGQPVKCNLFPGQAIFQNYFLRYNPQAEVGRMATNSCKLLQKALIGVCYLRWTPIQYRKIVVKIVVNKAGRYSTVTEDENLLCYYRGETKSQRALFCYARQQTTTFALNAFFMVSAKRTPFHYSCLYKDIHLEMFLS